MKMIQSRNNSHLNLLVEKNRRMKRMMRKMKRLRKEMKIKRGMKTCDTQIQTNHKL
jgi:hypothetical protein